MKCIWYGIVILAENVIPVESIVTKPSSYRTLTPLAEASWPVSGRTERSCLLHYNVVQHLCPEQHALIKNLNQPLALIDFIRCPAHVRSVFPSNCQY